MQGDALFFAFAKATDAVAAAQEGQAALQNTEMRVRMGLHTGEPLLTEEGYVGVDVHRAARICSSAHGGQVVLSDTTARLVGADLRDLGLHRLKDLAAPRTLYQLGQREFPPLRTPKLSNLPVQATEIIGREGEGAAAVALLREHRLVTLVGPGGTGKTRLALQVATEVIEEFDDGVFWISLAAVHDTELVESTIAQVLEVTDNLAGYLANRQILLLLDNFEQVVEAAPRLAQLLASAPRLKLLVTSREPLGISAEWVYAVPPLPPTDAFALFTERASAVRSGFTADDAVAAICRRLDGLPLALELAAARVTVLTPAQILERLGRSLDLLTTSARDLPVRQRTMRATVEWSFDLLAQEEKDLFVRLAVFSGGCTLEAAEAVCDASLDVLQSLVAKSLVARADERFSMLETLREFALARLETSPEQDMLRERHAHFFLALAEEAAPQLERGEQLWTWIGRLSRELDNLRAAIQRFAQSGEVDLEQRLVAAVLRFWFEQGLWQESSRLAERALALTSAVTRARTVVTLGAAWVVWRQGDVARGTRLAEEGLQLSKALDDQHLLARALRTLAVCHMRDDPARGARLLEESARLCETTGDAAGLSAALNNLGTLATQAGDHREAAQDFERALSIARQTNNARSMCVALLNLACAERELGDYQHAREHYAESLAAARSLNYREVTTEVLYGAAALADAISDHGWAGALIGAARREGDFGHTFDLDADRVALERTLASLERNLGVDGLENALAAGRSMPLDAVADHLAGTTERDGVGLAPPAPRPNVTDALALVEGLESVNMSSFTVVGRYARFDESVRNALKDARLNIVGGLHKPGLKRNAHLIWAAPGTGKTYFVEQVAASLDGVTYRDTNLAKCTELEFLAFLDGLDMRGQTRSLCFIDECDARPQEAWPYELLLPCLDAAVSHRANIVFVFAGSSGSTLDAMKDRMASRPKGVDLLSRIPSTNEYSIAPMGIGDRVVVALTHLLGAAREAGHELRAVERMALFYVAIDPRLASARQLREFAVRAIERMQPGENRLKYDHLFGPGSPENKGFWMQWRPHHSGLVNRFVAVSEYVSDGR